MSLVVRLAIAALVCIAGMSMIRAPDTVSNYIEATYWNTKSSLEKLVPGLEVWLPYSINITPICRVLGALLLVSSMMLSSNIYKYPLIIFIPLCVGLLFIHLPLPEVEQSNTRVRVVLLIFGFLTAIFMSNEENALQKEVEDEEEVDEEEEKKEVKESGDSIKAPQQAKDTVKQEAQSEAK